MKTIDRCRTCSECELPLPQLVYDVVVSNPTPNGLKHAEVVRGVLQRGYTHRCPEPLSDMIYAILREFVSDGTITRSEDANVRRYTAKQLCVA